jgi:hypothetical protein
MRLLAIVIALLLVAGANAFELPGLMQREIGEPSRLLIQRGSGEPFAVTLIAVVGRPE